MTQTVWLGQIPQKWILQGSTSSLLSLALPLPKLPVAKVAKQKKKGFLAAKQD